MAQQLQNPEGDCFRSTASILEIWAGEYLEVIQLLTFNSDIQSGSENISDNVSSPRQTVRLGMSYREKVACFSRIVAMDPFHVEMDPGTAG